MPTATVDIQSHAHLMGYHEHIRLSLQFHNHWFQSSDEILVRFTRWVAIVVLKHTVLFQPVIIRSSYQTVSLIISFSPLYVFGPMCRDNYYTVYKNDNNKNIELVCTLSLSLSPNCFGYLASKSSYVRPSQIPWTHKWLQFLLLPLSLRLPDSVFRILHTDHEAKKWHVHINIF